MKEAPHPGSCPGGRHSSQPALPAQSASPSAAAMTMLTPTPSTPIAPGPAGEEEAADVDRCMAT